MIQLLAYCWMMKIKSKNDTAPSNSLTKFRNKIVQVHRMSGIYLTRIFGDDNDVILKQMKKWPPIVTLTCAFK